MNFISEFNRIYANDDNGRLVAEVRFPPVGAGAVDIERTFVDDSLAGKGVASALLDAAYDKIKNDGKKARATCSYAVKWFEKHEDKRDILIH
jgi:predicted GNAT family acetyltransferase